MAANATAAAEAAAIAAAIKEAQYFIQASQTIFAALYAVCLWDWLTSLQREWNLIWKSRWSIIKVLYLLCRYWVIIVMPYILWVFLTNHSEADCLKLFRSPVALAMWNQIWAESVLMIRCYAFLGNKLPVLIFLIVLLCGVAAYQLWCDTTQMALLPFLDPSGGPCFPTVKHPGSAQIMLFFLVALVYDIVVTLLTLFRAWQLRQQVGNSSPLLKTFVTEGLYYFVLISGANLINAIFYWQPKQVMSAMLIPFSVVFPDILACRMILGLRERGIRHTSGHATSGSYSHSARKITGGPGRMTAGGKPTTAGGILPTSAAVYPSSKDVGAITDMGFNHELTTFHQTQHVVGADSDSVVGRDVKTIPYEVEDAPPANDARARAGIRIDIESHKYYEERSDGESDHKGGLKSFVP